LACIPAFETPPAHDIECSGLTNPAASGTVAIGIDAVDIEVGVGQKFTAVFALGMVLSEREDMV
jgi:hypothetical protein